jgi:hypothetical protein
MSLLFQKCVVKFSRRQHQKSKITNTGSANEFSFPWSDPPPSLKFQNWWFVTRSQVHFPKHLYNFRTWTQNTTPSLPINMFFHAWSLKTINTDLAVKWKIHDFSYTFHGSSHLLIFTNQTILPLGRLRCGTVQVHGLSLSLVYGAGHMSPHQQPLQSWVLFAQLLLLNANRNFEQAMSWSELIVIYIIQVGQWSC